MIVSILLAAMLLFASPAQRQGPPGGQPGQQRSGEPQARQDAPRPADRSPDTKDKPAPPEVPPVVTKHEINAGRRTLRYTVTTGLMPIRNQQGDTEANIFFMAYTLDGASNIAERPLMFSFNGGPGSSSVWLHLGALGPKRVKMLEDGSMPPPPYQLVDNQQTWLDQTDLVFIDPVGTGYSRAVKPELATKFFGVRGDMESVGEFIRMYLTRFERWSSPLFLVGESYGTTRASGLSGYLVDRGIALNGVILISTVMSFQTVRFAQGNDLPIILILPSYTATAWYHKKLPPDLQKKELRKVLDEAESWAAGEYTVALGKGDSLTASERKAVIDKLSRYTGLDAGYIDRCNLRVDLSHFNKELLRDDKRTSGRLDSRFKGIDASTVSERPDSDPSNNAIRPPYTAAFNNYVRTELGYKSDVEYFILGGGIGRWDWGVDNGYADTSDSLRNAFAKNPFLKVYVAMGYYDMATPYFAAQYTLNHMNLDPSQRANIKTGYYEAGHMMYIDTRSLAQLKQDVSAFVQSAASRQP